MVFPVPFPPKRQNNSPSYSLKLSPLTTSGRFFSYLKNKSSAVRTSFCPTKYSFFIGKAHSTPLTYSVKNLPPSPIVTGHDTSVLHSAHTRIATGIAPKIALAAFFNRSPTSLTLPVCVILPFSKTATLLATGSTSSNLCSVRITVIPNSLFTLVSIARKSDAEIGSS